MLALLVYLAVEGGLHTRKTLSEAFWPELDAEHGRPALRSTLLELRKLLERTHVSGEQAHLLAEHDLPGFDQSSPLMLDLRLVESACTQVYRGHEAKANQARESLLAQLEQATGQARGQFLADFTLRGSQFFDDWTRQQREYWHRHTAPFASPQARSLPSSVTSPGQPPANLLDGPLQGRTAEFGTLIESYQRAHAAQPQFVLLQRETGNGKTRLATEFARWAQAQGADVLAGKALQTGRHLSYQPLIDALRLQMEQVRAGYATD